MKAFDYVVVGAGAAGAVIAHRLSEDANMTVLVLEAGPKDTNPNIHRPAGLFRLFGGDLTWNYTTTPQSHANNREMLFLQGRVLGGGTSINGQVFTRGCPEDYDRWAQDEGCPGWSFEDVRPYFRKSEDNDLLKDAYHGTGGPQAVSTMNADDLTRAFVRACQQAGIAYTADFNGRSPAGAGVLSDVHAQPQTLLDGCGLSASGARSTQPDGSNGLYRHQNRCRSGPSRWRQLPGAWSDPPGPSKPGGHRHRGRDRIATAPDALWHWAG